MRFWSSRFLAAAAVCFLGAGSARAESPDGYPLMDRDEEIALARSAGLAPWNAGATVYVLAERGYVKAVEGDNGFSCVVGRDEPGTRWPICFDPVGTKALLPRVLREAEMRRAGARREEVAADSAKRFMTGEYRAPDAPSVTYMLSPDAITSNGKTLLTTPPHLMISAPHVRPDDFGAVARHPHSPMVLYPGDPHAYLVIFVRDEPVDIAPIETSPAAERP